MKVKRLGVLFALLSHRLIHAQTTSQQVSAILESSVLSRQVVTFQLQEYLLRRAPRLPSPTGASQWSAEAARIRKHLLNDVVFHGWPRAWVDAPPRIEDLGEIPAGKGYRLRKLRYEIVPGFYSTALLYEPAKLQGKVSAVLDVMGHFYQQGKAVEFEQAFCINQALRGMMVLNLEWLNTGELHAEGNDHWLGAELDLVGANEVGLFYLAMRRGLDFLYGHPNVDQKRIAVTGLSGGGWQTIVLSALDDRVYASIPVAGYTSLVGAIGRMPIRPDEPGDLEQKPTDFLAGQDYSTLTAMRAPRPTLLINNAEDDCCFRAPLVQSYIFDAVRPFFQLYGHLDAFQFHANTDISAHNYGLDNRQQAYIFLAQSFGLPAAEPEIPVGADIKTYSELAVGLPKDNLTILSLARKMAKQITRSPVPMSPADKSAWIESERARLKEVARYDPVTVEQAWAVANTNHNQVESQSFRFLLSNGLSATGVWMKNNPTPSGAPLTVVLNDKGAKAAAAEVWDRLPEVADRMDRGEQVLVLDLLFTGDAAPDQPSHFYTELLAATGERPIGMEAAQLIALTRWAVERWHAPRVRLESAGMRSQVVSLIVSALEPRLFPEVAVRGGMRSLSYLLDKPVSYLEAPDLFCLDLYKDFDLDRLTALSEPAKVQEGDFVEDTVTPEQAGSNAKQSPHVR